jgi:cytochrome c
VPGVEAEPEPVGPEPIGPLLAAASVDAGETVARRCAACHTFEQGGRDGVGPHLWGVVERDIASVAGFNYSPALQAIEGVWDYQHLNDFLYDPAAYAPGNRMAFAGLRSTDDRANIIAYMRTLHDDPPPLLEEGAADADEAGAEAAEEPGEEPPVEDEAEGG